MKTVLFDLYEAQPAGTSKFHGGGEYIKTVYKFILDNLLDACRLIVFYDKSRFIDEWILESFKDKRLCVESISERSHVGSIFSKYNIDVFYSGIPYHYKREWFPDNITIKGTIHGLRDIELPCDKYSYMYCSGKESIIQRLRYLLQNKIRNKKILQFKSCIDLLDEVVCVSKHTKYSVMCTYSEAKNKKMYTYYTPAKFIEINNEKEIEVTKDYGKFILLMGGDRWVKNSYRALIALKEMINGKLLEGYKIVVVGAIHPKIKKELVEYADVFSILEYVPTEKLESLYKSCDFFIYPSLNEGFGMPPLEAMKYGKTCVVSGVCSLTEVCGDASYYINPYDINEMKIRILEAVNSKIAEESIKRHLDIINDKQKNDLRKVCEFIVR